MEVGDVRRDIGPCEERDDCEDAQAACAGQRVQVEVAVGEVEGEQRRVVVAEVTERADGLCGGGVSDSHGQAPLCEPSRVEGAGGYHAGRVLQRGWARITAERRTKCVDSVQISQKSEFSTSDFQAWRIASIAPHSA